MARGLKGKRLIDTTFEKQLSSKNFDVKNYIKDYDQKKGKRSKMEENFAEFYELNANSKIIDINIDNYEELVL